MKTRKTLPFHLLSILVLLVLILASTRQKAAGEELSKLEFSQSLDKSTTLGTGFTYQGYLTEGHEPANGIYHFSFELFDDELAGSSYGLIEVEDVQVDSGHFTAILNFGPGVFYGEDRWLQMGVLPEGSTGEYIPIEGRQMLRPIPYALFSIMAGSVDWVDITNRPPGLDNGDQDTTYSAGFGLELIATTFNVMTGTLQTRVEADCTVGSTVRVIHADGSVECEPHDTRPVFSRTTVDTNVGVGLYTDTTIGADGLPVISYLDHANGDLKVARCHDLPCTHATTTTIDSTGLVGVDTSITIGADGLPIISYYDWTNEDLNVAHCDDVACTTAYTRTLDSTDWVGASSSIAIGTDGLPVISYNDISNGDLKVAHCGDPACTTSSTNTVDDGGGLTVGRYTSIAIGVDGLPIISYYDASREYLMAAHCDDAACTTADISILDNEVSGMGTSIAIGWDSLPVISYMDADQGIIRVAKCSVISCTNATIHVIDTGTAFGDRTSIVIGADGMPVISYYDAYDGDLKVAHCDDPACTSARVNLVDTIKDVGLHASIALGMDGMPIISYFHVSDGTLTVTHCSNVFCIPYWRR